MVHVDELTQPQGHSTSGSHERYKSKERLAWEAEHDCNRVFRQWILANGYATTDELETIEAEAKEVAKKARINAWNAFQQSMKGDFDDVLDLLQQAARHQAKGPALMAIREELRKESMPLRRDAVAAARKALRMLRTDKSPVREQLRVWLKRTNAENEDRFSSHLYSESPESPMLITAFRRSSPKIA